MGFLCCSQNLVRQYSHGFLFRKNSSQHSLPTRGPYRQTVGVLACACPEARDPVDYLHGSSAPSASSLPASSSRARLESRSKPRRRRARASGATRRPPPPLRLRGTTTAQCAPHPGLATVALCSRRRGLVRRPSPPLATRARRALAPRDSSQAAVQAAPSGGLPRLVRAGEGDSPPPPPRCCCIARVPRQARRVPPVAAPPPRWRIGSCPLLRLGEASAGESDGTRLAAGGACGDCGRRLPPPVPPPAADDRDSRPTGPECELG